MRKDKHQALSSPHPTEKPKTSTALTLQELNKETTGTETATAEKPKTSTALTLQELNKETEKKETAAETARTRCRVCFKEIAPVRRCSGHGGGGGGGGGSGSADKSEEKAALSEEKSLTHEAHHTIDAEMEFIIGEGEEEYSAQELDSLSKTEEQKFNPEVIAELVATGLLVINNDRKSRTLTLSLQCDPNSLSKEQRNELKKFMNAILKEFNEFKEQNHLSDDCVNIIQDEKGNIRSLSINLPKLDLYDAFIQRLANNLVPTPRPELQAQNDNSKTKNFAPSPLSMEPKPSNKDKPVTKNEVAQGVDVLSKQAEEEEEQKLFSLSPFSTQLTPWK
ncbi:hypothetical protein [Legionella fallonii]|uniref:Uncharacterized protein n=1 Tax=Legionella fallonii LLAP-10 TaxID=1212491 RepID=A0A098GAC9_9GAMM|nr:hypothetical protein [Legionella fallonii]CEG58440.1 conserved protein of unknown function [Legionella fallonii LLAP-10]